MRTSAQKVILITGATSGIGLECANFLTKQGHTVYGGGRHAEATTDCPFHPLRMDVTRDESVQSTIDQILQKENRLDIVINNAGIGIAGAVEDTIITEAKNQFDTNFFGVHRVCRAVLPIMRSQKSGLIINISSIAGVVSIPFQALYSASKFALEGYSEALRIEVAPFGIRVVLIQPGNFQSRFTANRKIVAAASNSPYNGRFERSLGTMARDEMNGAHPERLANLVEKIIHSKQPKLRFKTGPIFDRLACTLKPVLPERLYEKAVRHYFHV